MTTAIRNCTFAFRCHADWDQLATTPDDDIRFCLACQREVQFCEDDAALANAIALNRCVAICLDDRLGGGCVTVGMPEVPEAA